MRNKKSLAGACERAFSATYILKVALERLELRGVDAEVAEIVLKGRVGGGVRSVELGVCGGEERGLRTTVEPSAMSR